VLEGTVVEPLPNAMFRVELENGTSAGTQFGKMRMHRIRILPATRSKLRYPYDLNRGRITYRTSKRRPTTVGHENE